MEQKFSTHLLDAAVQRKRVEREECRERLLDRTLAVLNLLAQRFQFTEAYVFGPLTKKGHSCRGVPSNLLAQLFKFPEHQDRPVSPGQMLPEG